jgi:hypothetical protein
MKAPDHGYKKGLEYFFRVRRHKREKRRWGRLGRRHLHRGDETYPAGDTNFDGMQLGGFVNCWDGYPGGDLGGRAVTIVYAAGRPSPPPHTVKTHSDHFAVAVTYPEENPMTKIRKILVAASPRSSSPSSRRYWRSS